MRLRLLTAGLTALVGTTACVVTLPMPSRPVVDETLPIIVAHQGTKNPVINSFTTDPTRVAKGQAITFQVVAFDPTDDVLQFNWSSTGGVLTANTGRVVSWTPPDKPGVYSVTVTVANRSGGFVTGSQNLTVTADGTTSLGGQPAIAPPVTVASPTPPASAPPSTEPGPSPTPSPVGTPSPSPSPSPVGLRVDGYASSDLGLPKPVPTDPNTGVELYVMHAVTLKAVSASQTVYYANFSTVWPTREGCGAMGGKVRADGSLRMDSTVPSVWVLQFNKSPMATAGQLPYESVTMSDGHDAVALLQPDPVKFSRANCPQPPNLLDRLKPLDGALYVFKYDGKGDLDLGTFQLP